MRRSRFVRYDGTGTGSNSWSISRFMIPMMGKLPAEKFLHFFLNSLKYPCRSADIRNAV